MTKAQAALAPLVMLQCKKGLLPSGGLFANLVK
jgi:hypothetical protein